jgi:hypothetical protein
MRSQVLSFSGGDLVFLSPECAQPGTEAELFFNRGMSDVLRGSSNVQLKFGFNNWRIDDFVQVDMEAAGVPAFGRFDWLRVKVKIPMEATEINAVFTDGCSWENNNSVGP